MSQDTRRSRNEDHSMEPVSTNYAWLTAGLDRATISTALSAFAFALVKLFAPNVDKDLVPHVEGNFMSDSFVACG